MRERNVDERPVFEGGGGVSARPLLAKDRQGFIADHDLWGEAQYAAHGQMRRVVDEVGVEMVRFVFADQHGILRGKTVTRGAVASVMRDGITLPSSLLLKDTSGKTVFSVFSEDTGVGSDGFRGASDLVMVPDPTTFRVLPWAGKTGWILCNLVFPDGRPVPFCPRTILQHELTTLASRGYSLTVGAELEFHVFRTQEQEFATGDLTIPNAAGGISPLYPTTPGNQLLHEDALDNMQPFVDELYRGLTLLDLPLRSIELEFGASQFEITMDAGEASTIADAVLLARSAVRSIARAMGLHATFMARPKSATGASTGWHLHQSLVDIRTGQNVFVPEEAGAPLSATGAAYLAGLLEHAAAATALTTPTVNGYKRFQPNSLAPDRIAWGIDNKGAMIRAVGGAGNPATRLEVRSGEPAANPYLYIVSQLISGMDGIDRELVPPEPTADPYMVEAPSLPASLGDAIEAFAGNQTFRSTLGATVVDWYAALKRAEFNRYLRDVSDWEQREYIGIF